MAEIVTAWSADGSTITRCPKCNTPLIRKPAQFHWRGETFDGAVCLKDNALWSIVGEEMPPLRPAKSTR